MIPPLWPPEFTQTHFHQVSDAIQPSHPLLSLSPPVDGSYSHPYPLHMPLPLYWVKWWTQKIGSLGTYEWDLIGEKGLYKC